MEWNLTHHCGWPGISLLNMTRIAVPFPPVAWCSGVDLATACKAHQATLLRFLLAFDLAPAIIGLAAHALGVGLRPGLWEVRQGLLLLCFPNLVCAPLRRLLRYDVYLTAWQAH